MSRIQPLVLACALCLGACGGGSGTDPENGDGEGQERVLAVVPFERPVNLGADLTGLEITLNDDLLLARFDASDALGQHDRIDQGTAFEQAAARWTDGLDGAILVQIENATRDFELVDGAEARNLVLLDPTADPATPDCTGAEITAFQLDIHEFEVTGNGRVRGLVRILGRKTASDREPLAIHFLTRGGDIPPPGPKGMQIVYDETIALGARLPGELGRSGLVLPDPGDPQSFIGLNERLTDGQPTPMDHFLNFDMFRTLVISKDDGRLQFLVDRLGPDLVGYEVTAVQLHVSKSVVIAFAAATVVDFEATVVIYGRTL